MKKLICKLVATNIYLKIVTDEASRSLFKNERNLEDNREILRNLLDDWVQDSYEGSNIAVKEEVKKRVLFCYDYNIHSLRLDGLELHSIPPLDGLKNLERLAIDGQNMHSDVQRNIRALPRLENLTALTIEGSAVTTLTPFEIEKFTKMNFLSLVANGIDNSASLPKFSSFPQLKGLLLQNNRLTDVSGIDVRGCSDLRILSLHSNYINELGGINLSDCRFLNDLLLSDNQLTDVSGLNLMNCTNLKKLNLSNNQLTFFNAVLPRNCNSTLKVNLEGNYFSPNYVWSILDRQSRYNYQGPELMVSSVSYLGGDNELKFLDEIITAWSHDANEPVWVKIKNAPESDLKRNQYLNFAVFLKKLYNDSPQIPDTKKPIESIQLRISFILEAIEQLFPNENLLDTCSKIATDCVSSDSEDLGVGLLQMIIYAQMACINPFHTPMFMKELKEDLFWVQKVSQFVRDINNIKIVYNCNQDRFVDLADISHELMISHNNQIAIDELSLEQREQIITQLVNEGYKLKIVKINDEIEDIILILNLLETNGLSTSYPINMRFSKSRSLNNQVLQNASIMYLREKSI